jgi:ABC-type uncharacterized transport system involved in gliding motility auxiliary subunit
MSERWIKFSGILGFVLIAFALIGSFILGFETAFANPVILSHFTLGAMLIVIWIFVSGSESVGRAGKAITGRGAQFGYLSLFAIALGVTIFAAVNYLGKKYNERWDLTEQGVYSLASQTTNLIKGLKKPLKLVGISGAALARAGQDIDPEAGKQLFDLVKYANPSLVTSELFDPKAKPHLVEKYEFKQGNLIYLEYGEGESKQVSRINEITEQALANAIIKLERGEAKKIYYVVGHGEPSITSNAPEGMQRLADGLRDENLTVEEIFLGEKGQVPNDAAALILAAPEKAYGPGEREAIIKYIEGGGRALILSEPRAPLTAQDLTEISKHFGITVDKNVVLDQVQRLFAGPAIGAEPMVREYAMHPTTKDFNKSNITVFSIASSLTIPPKSEDGVTYTELLKTGLSAWGETNLEALFSEEPSAEMGVEDKKGPLTLGVVYEKALQSDDPTRPKSARLIVIGDSDWLKNGRISLLSNRDLALNLVNWLSGEEGSVTIGTRAIKASSAPIGEGQFLKILAVSFLVPELILIVGLLVWWRRKTVYA